ncbi:MAG: trigger factor [Rhodospirillales bacterium]|nr:trigger factor [Rhodospirillales bacterium]MCB9995567.1 trigger factor [Rhodospirillales bacterium]
MQVKEVKSEGLSHELEVTVTAKDIDQKVDMKLQEYSKTMKLPGFRPGHVPLNILKQRYGKAVLGEVLEQAVNDSTQKVLMDKNLRPALQPKIEVKEFDEGKDLVYSMVVEVMPEFEIMDLKTVKLEKPVAKADKKAVDDALERIASSNKDSEVVERAAKKGDILVIDFHGRTKDDGVEHQGMHAHGQQLELGSGQFIAGFEDQLTGKKAGDKVEVTVTFPDPYHSAELAGREAIFDVDVQEVRETKPAKIDDEFAKQLGLEDEKALRKAVEEQIQAEYDQVSRMKLKRELLDLLDDKHDFPVPAGMLELEFGNIRQQIAIERPDQVQDGELKLAKDEEEELQAISERRVRLGMILSEVGRQNNIQVTDHELQRAVITEAQRYPGQEAQVFEYYKSNRQALEALRAPVYEDKVVDFIVELADIKEKDVSVDALTADDEDDESYLDKKKGKKSSSSEGGEKKAPAKKAAAKKKKAS